MFTFMIKENVEDFENVRAQNINQAQGKSC